MSVRQAAVTPLSRVRRAEGDLAVLRALLRPEFLEEAGWDPERQALAPPRSHPQLGVRLCIVVDCDAKTRSREVEFCGTCEQRYEAQGRPGLGDFAAIPANKRAVGEQICVAPACERPKHGREGLCSSHAQHRKKQRDLSLEEWLATSPAAATAYPSYGECVVPPCIRRAASKSGLCIAHRARWMKHRYREPDADQAEWIAGESSACTDYVAVFKGLSERLQTEILLGLQVRTDAGIRTPLATLRAIVVLARERRAGSIADLQGVSVSRGRRDVTAMVTMMCRDLRRLVSTPESERANDVWDLAVFGAGGSLDFIPISQAWLREAAKHWAVEDLPTHRGSHASSNTRAAVKALGRLSEVLRLARDDQGEDPSALGRGDIVVFLNRLAYQEQAGTLTANVRVHTTRKVRLFLDDIRAFGLTRPGQVLEGLPADFAMRHTDIPDDSQIERRGRNIPGSVMRTLSGRLDVLQDRSGVSERRAVELLMDTGRRPDEICRLPWDCLERDAGGKPVLVYTDFKRNRTGRRLPISEDTATIIAAQKSLVRERFPGTPVGALALFPRYQANRDGTKPMRQDVLGGAHRAWVNEIAEELLDEDGQRFDPAQVVPYGYRHHYAQRHADSGVTPDILRDLMGHKTMQMTLTYYRVTEKRVRGAVDRVARHQFDGHGTRVIHSVAGLLAEEHMRLRVGQVAVPFGICTEPSNVKAGGQACPYKFTCLGCGHFRSDASYLPELKSYLQQLLADRERLRAADDIDGWAREQLMPRHEEIDQLRHLIRRIELDLDDLSEDEQAAITEAVKVIRKTRQVVSLGMPAVKPVIAQRNRDAE